jgi:hypothetical protein
LETEPNEELKTEANGDLPSTEPSTQISKNKRKKDKKNKNKNKKEFVNKLKERNASKIKCTGDLETEGYITELNDIALDNLNRKSIYNFRGGRKEGSTSSSSESDSSEDDNDVEELDDYGVDGYHACHVGEIIDSKYVVLKKLGWGHFSTVWLAFKLSDK